MSVNLRWDSETDMGYIALTAVPDGAVHRSVPVQSEFGDVVLDYDSRGVLLGIEVFDASKHLPMQLVDIRSGPVPA